jgi:hypothetical protein
MASVEEKLSMLQISPPTKKNETQMIKRLGLSNSEIRYLGKTNQKIRRRLY